MSTQKPDPKPVAVLYKSLGLRPSTVRPECLDLVGHRHMSDGTIQSLVLRENMPYWEAELEFVSAAHTHVFGPAGGGSPSDAMVAV